MGVRRAAMAFHATATDCANATDFIGVPIVPLPIIVLEPLASASTGMSHVRLRAQGVSVYGIFPMPLQFFILMT
jgi:hypothetical protein